MSVWRVSRYEFVEQLARSGLVKERMHDVHVLDIALPQIVDGRLIKIQCSIGLQAARCVLVGARLRAGVGVRWKPATPDSLWWRRRV